MADNINDVFVGEFTEKEKNGAAKKILKRQNDVRHEAIIYLVTAVIACAIFIVCAVIVIINFKDIAESEMEAYEESAGSSIKAVTSARDIDGPAGIIEWVFFIFFAPFSLGYIAEAIHRYKRNTAAVSRYKVYKCIFISSIENPCIKGLYNTKIRIEDRTVEFDTRCESITDFSPGDEITVIDFIAIKGKEPEKLYDYNSFEQGFLKALGKGRAYAAESDKYIIV